MKEKEKTITHESFGLLSLSRITCNVGVPLFGSSIKHKNTIILRIHTAEKKRNLCSDWLHGKKKIIEVEMSPLQFTDMITNMNTQGVPVTIRHINGKRTSDFQHVNVRETFQQEFREHIQEVLGGTEKMLKEAEKLLKAPGTLKKADREKMANTLYHLAQDIKSNLPFVFKQFNKQVDRSIGEAKSEVESFFANTIHALGSEKLVRMLENGELSSIEMDMKAREKPRKIRRIKQ